MKIIAKFNYIAIAKITLIYQWEFNELSSLLLEK